MDEPPAEADTGSAESPTNHSPDTTTNNASAIANNDSAATAAELQITEEEAGTPEQTPLGVFCFTSINHPGIRFSLSVSKSFVTSIFNSERVYRYFRIIFLLPFRKCHPGFAVT